jgi:hypothetical protein
VHLHRCKHIELSVRFGSEQVGHRFPTAMTITHVRKWAGHKLGMQLSDIAEHVLQIQGTQTQPEVDVHIGTLAKCPNCSLAFDLVPANRINGQGDGNMAADEKSLRADLASARFLSGEDRGRWKLEKLEWPHLEVSVIARDGRAFTLRLHCASFPHQGPTGTFWEMDTSARLPFRRWPTGGERTNLAFEPGWQDGNALYIPRIACRSLVTTTGPRSTPS